MSRKRSRSSSSSDSSSSSESRSRSSSESSRSRTSSKKSNRSKSSSSSSSSDRKSRSRSRSDSSRSSRSSKSSSKERRRSRSKSRGFKKSLSPKNVKSPFSSKPTKIYIGRLSRNVLKEHVNEIFCNYGLIKSIEIPVDKIHPYLSRGFAYVEYEKPEDSEKAIKYMDGGQIDGQVINVSIAIGPHKQRYPGPLRRGIGSGPATWRNKSPPSRRKRSPPRYRGKTSRRSRSRSYSSPRRRRKSSSRSSSR